MLCAKHVSFQRTKLAHDKNASRACYVGFFSHSSSAVHSTFARVFIVPLRSCTSLPTVLLELPVAVVERADLTCLEPARDAVEVEGVL